MITYTPCGELAGRQAGASDLTLLLPRDRPLSYLCVADATGRHTLARELLENQATEFRRRIPIAVGDDDAFADRDHTVATLMRYGVSTTFPVLRGQVDGQPLDVYWLDSVQLRALGRHENMGLRRSQGTTQVVDLEVPTFEATDEASAGEPASADSTLPARWSLMQYWNSNWSYSSPPPNFDSWWRIKPNGSRNRTRSPRIPLLRDSQVRGASAACVHPEHYERLGKPTYFVVEHPYRRGSFLSVLALPDPVLAAKPPDPEAKPRSYWEQTLFLDRTAREALGISDGEFCIVNIWPVRKLSRRFIRDRYISPRTIAALVKIPARADLEKEVCRLETDALEAIGGRADDFVSVEALLPPGEDESPAPDPLPGIAAAQSRTKWRSVRVTQRVLTVDAEEKAQRSKWEAPQTWDDTPLRSPDTLPVLREGYVDCAESLGVQPPYPTIYLNYYVRERLGTQLCRPVQVRVSILNRLGAEAGEFVWIAFIGLLATVGATLGAPLVIAVAAFAIITFLLVVVRSVRSIR